MLQAAGLAPIDDQLSTEQFQIKGLVYGNDGLVILVALLIPTS